MKKSLKKQAVFPVLMLLVVTALALIGSSFAWFSMANTAKLNTVSGKIEKSSVGLMISQDAANFTASITLDSHAATFVNPKYFHQMSSKDGKTFYEATIVAKNADGSAKLIYTTASDNEPAANGTGKLSGWYGDSASPTLLASGAQETAADTNVNQAGYMVFDLFFSVEYASDLYLDYGTTFTLGTGNEAMRVAFFDYGSVASNVENAAAQAIALTSTADATAIWDPADGATYYGIKGASTNAKTFAPYAATADKTTSGGTDDSSTYAVEVDNLTSAELFPTGEGANYLDDDSDLTPYTAIASLDAGINKVRVVVWLEGNDPTCTTSIAELSISFAMNFYARKTSTTPVTP